ncbi:type II toxin-antitoxin system VapC family toxin [Methyloversatilis sp. XJ19-13]|uniref:type II toxin-antitoxin system VapC family toxin n=1 Tax=Methyloversatilis sp. XJ19-13 TaxID=2963430 RepID=UPI00211BEB1F|nr:type II toxin-antitoxin system VapC family toxin [Methyloversatilis sp. XJ19-13]MCQ9376366.1 type II toxin-antitoxin system VapC family toxin [Methyloversatilis sp. XJ19-13]
MLDTNICIYLMARQPPQVVARFQQARAGDIAISVVTYAELCHGVERCQGADRDLAAAGLRRLTQRVPVLVFDQAAAERYGALAAAVRDRRRDALDRMIAAHAVSVDAVLVTNNEADFADYPGLVVENWTRAPAAPA